MPKSNDIPKGLLLKKFIEIHEFHVQTNHADAFSKARLKCLYLPSQLIVPYF